MGVTDGRRSNNDCGRPLRGCGIQDALSCSGSSSVTLRRQTQQGSRDRVGVDLRQNGSRRPEGPGSQVLINSHSRSRERTQWQTAKYSSRNRVVTAHRAQTSVQVPQLTFEDEGRVESRQVDLTPFGMTHTVRRDIEAPLGRIALDVAHHGGGIST